MVGLVLLLSVSLLLHSVSLLLHSVSLLLRSVSLLLLSVSRYRVANHMGNQRQGDWNNFTFFTPFNQQDHYHSFCEIKDFSNQNEVCTLMCVSVFVCMHMCVCVCVCVCVRVCVCV